MDPPCGSTYSGFIWLWSRNDLHPCIAFRTFTQECSPLIPNLLKPAHFVMLCAVLCFALQPSHSRHYDCPFTTWLSVVNIPWRWDWFVFTAPRLVVRLASPCLKRDSLADVQQYICKMLPQLWVHPIHVRFSFDAGLQCTSRMGMPIDVIVNDGLEIFPFTHSFSPFGGNNAPLPTAW